jgi:hypothetical protein
MAFPSSPTNGQTSARFGRDFEYNATKQRWGSVFTLPIFTSPIPSTGSDGQLQLVSSTGGVIADTPLFIEGADAFQYRYHVFTSSSSFVSSGSGLVDILIVAGGGGGTDGQSGGSSGGGGSGGAVTILTNQTVAAQSYTVTLAAGGARLTAGGTSSISGISGASAAGGATGTAAYQAGSGAGGPQTGTASPTSARVGGPGLATDFFQHLDITSIDSIANLRSEMWGNMVYLGGGGTSGYAESDNTGRYRGVALLGGGSGSYSETYHANFGFTTGSSNIFGGSREAMPNTGGGGAAGLRASSVYTQGTNGARGLVVIKYKI